MPGVHLVPSDTVSALECSRLDPQCPGKGRGDVGAGDEINKVRKDRMGKNAPIVKFSVLRDVI